MVTKWYIVFECS